MKNRGFTLIELLAVIVILAIIALIATPVILGIINDTRDSAKQRSAELVGKEIQFAYTSYVLGTKSADASTICNFMTSDYFKMDSMTSVTCSEGTATVTLNSGDVFTVVYDDGVVTVSGASEPVEVKIVASTSQSPRSRRCQTGRGQEGFPRRAAPSPSSRF